MLNRTISSNSSCSSQFSCSPTEWAKGVCEFVFDGLKLNELNFPCSDQIYPFDLDQLEQQGTIDVNRNCTVEKYRHKPTNKEMAIKILNIPIGGFGSIDNRLNDSRLKKIRNEIELHQKLSSFDNVVKLYGTSLIQTKLYLCMELMDMSLHVLYQLTHRNWHEFPENLLGLIVVNIVDALIYLKSHNIMHRDIKPHNILIQQIGYIKLCDFGMSRCLEESFASSTVGTCLYWPPEVFEIETKKFDIRSDVWSFGLTLAESSYGRYPIIDQLPEECNLIQLQKSISKVNGKEIVEKCMKRNSDDAKKFVGFCLEELAQRPKFDILKEMDFYLHYADLNSSAYIRTILEKIDYNVDGSIEMQQNSLSETDPSIKSHMPEPVPSDREVTHCPIMPKGLGYTKPLSINQFNVLKSRGYDFYFAKVHNCTNQINETGIKNMENAEKAGLETFPFVHAFVNFESENTAASQVLAIIDALKNADISKYFQNPVLVFGILSDEDQEWDLDDKNKNREFIWELICAAKEQGFVPAIYTMRKYWLEIVGEWEKPEVYECPLFWPQYTALANAYRTFRKFGNWTRPYAHHYAKNIDIYYEENGKKTRILVYNIRLYKYESTITMDPYIEMLSSVEKIGTLLIDGKSYEFDLAWLDRIAIIDTDVSKYFHEPSGKNMAVKHAVIPTANTENRSLVEQIRNEIEIRLKMESHPHIVDIYGLVLDIQNVSRELDMERKLWISMELMDFSLQQYIEKFPYESSEVDERLLGYIVVSVVQALGYLKLNGIMHSDIKPRNILFGFEGRIKLANFDLAGLICDFDKHDKRNVILSIGTTLLRTIIGKNSFEKGDEGTTISESKGLELIEAVSKGRPNYTEMLKEFLKKSLRETLETCLDIEKLTQDTFFMHYEPETKEENIKMFTSSYPEFIADKLDFLLVK